MLVGVQVVLAGQFSDEAVGLLLEFLIGDALEQRCHVAEQGLRGAEEIVGTNRAPLAQTLGDITAPVIGGLRGRA